LKTAQLYDKETSQAKNEHFEMHCNHNTPEANANKLRLIGRLNYKWDERYEIPSFYVFHHFYVGRKGCIINPVALTPDVYLALLTAKNSI
jgi:hypothetical protein